MHNAVKFMTVTTDRLEIFVRSQASTTGVLLDIGVLLDCDSALGVLMTSSTASAIQTAFHILKLRTHHPRAPPLDI